MESKKILVIEDELEIRELLEYNLKREGYLVDMAKNGEEGLNSALSNEPDLILLDLMLPGLDGLETCRRLRRDPKTELTPLIMLTAKSEEADIVTGLELGADDYVTKPFSPKVLIARVRALLRRKVSDDSNEQSIIKVRDLYINPGRHEVRIGSESIKLTLTEFKILQVMASRPGWVFTRNQLIDSVRGDEAIITDRSIDVQIVGLRRKMGEAGQYITTVRGIGYRFEEE